MKKIYLVTIIVLLLIGCEKGKVQSPPQDSTEEALEYFKSLRGNEIWKNIFDRNKVKEITVLGFEGLSIADERLHYLLIFPKLNTLMLSKTKITEKGLATLKGNKVASLQIDLTPITNEAIKVLREDWEEIIVLNICYTKVDDRAVDDLLKMKKLDSIHLAGTYISEAGKARLKKKGIGVDEERYDMDEEQKRYLEGYGFVCRPGDFDCLPPNHPFLNKNKE
ncbi:hypothetical protein [Leptospira weilii]|uniref:hypothetical protein n=1 Tax=Leptospira weilii TaxID=28184 RepID=UPI0007735177|nr:hypothetical protein [Leptospira weilii]